MQRGFDQLRKTVDIGVANVSGEVGQVGEKLTGFQSAMTDEFANFRSTVTEHLDIELLWCVWIDDQWQRAVFHIVITGTKRTSKLKTTQKHT